jgi:uncharacterized protein (TIRG00374 family)
MDLSKFLPAIGILIFVIILLNNDIPAIIELILGADPFLLGIVLLLHVPAILLKATKWKLITNAYGKPAPIAKCIHGWLVGFMIGIATPGRIGEMTKAYYLKDEMPTGGGLSTVVIDRIIDILVLFVMAISGGIIFMAAYSGFLQSDFFIFISIFFIAFVSGTFFVLARGDFVRRLVRPMYDRFAPRKHKSRMKDAFNEFYLGLGKIRKRKRFVVLSVALSFLSWMIAILQYNVIATAMSIQVSYLFLLSVMPVIILLDALPISFSGLGTREVALIFFFGAIGIPMGMAISFSVMVFLLGYVVFIPFGLASWLLRPVRIRT